MRKCGMKRGTPETLILGRQCCGRGFRYVDAKGLTFKEAPTITRLRSLAVPPARSSHGSAERNDGPLKRAATAAEKALDTSPFGFAV